MSEPTKPDPFDFDWDPLAAVLGFVWDTVEPIPGKGSEWFTAEVV